jgi:hypothetical protein
MVERLTKKSLIVLTTVFLFSIYSYASSGQHEDPPHKMIDQAFFKCDASKNLEGGIYGKGPFKRFGPKQSQCSKDEWVKISKEEFKTLAEKWYGFDRSHEIPYWVHR